MRVKVSEAEREVLDWMVAVANGENRNCLVDGFNPSTNWAQGGPIIEREEMTVCCHWLRPFATKLVKDTRKIIQCRGDTPLIAAMRCFVCSKLGDEVDVPEGLV